MTRNVTPSTRAHPAISDTAISKEREHHHASTNHASLLNTKQTPSHSVCWVLRSVSLSFTVRLNPPVRIPILMTSKSGACLYAPEPIGKNQHWSLERKVRKQSLCAQPFANVAAISYQIMGWNGRNYCKLGTVCNILNKAFKKSIWEMHIL